jgi:hypothetical protein
MGGVFRAVKSIFSTPSAPSLPAPSLPAPDPTPAVVAASPEEAVLPTEVEAPSEAKGALLKNKKKGRYATLLTGGKGVLGDTEVGTKSLLGS